MVQRHGFTRILVLPLLILCAACRSTPDPPPLTDDPELNAFVRQVAADLEAHDWQEIIGVADPDHYRIQVEEHGMPEPQYVAELLGLHRVGNDIKRGERVEWSDLERIEAVELHSLSRRVTRSTLAGTATLADGSTLSIRASVEQDGGDYVLTGGVG